MNNQKVSVIVPVYNVEKLLQRCFDSILAQTFTDFELLLIDDGSKDKSGEICDGYAAKDSRIRVFHKQNEGVSTARNLGIDKAQGEWIYFVDSDDIVLPSALGTFGSLIYSESELVMAGFYTSDENNTVREQRKMVSQCELSVIQALREMYAPTDFCYQGYLWCKLFKRKVILQNNLRFEETISFNEDRLFIVEYFMARFNSLLKMFNQDFPMVDSLLEYQERAIQINQSPNVDFEKLLIKKESLKFLREALS